MGGDWLLGLAFGTTATAAAGMEIAAGQVMPIRLPGGVITIPADSDGAVSALRTVLHAALANRSGPPPSGLALAYPDDWPPQQVTTLTHAAAALGYPANLVRPIPISAAAAHNSVGYPEDNPVSAAARGALLAVIGPVPSYQAPQQSIPPHNPVTAGTRPPVSRSAWIWAAAIAVIVVIIGGTTAVVLTDRDDPTSTATGTTTTRSTPARPATTSPSAAPLPTPTAGIPDPAAPSTPPPPATTTTEPPPTTTTTRTVPAPTQPVAPAQPSPSEEVPTTDVHEAAIRGSCKGFLQQVDTFPGGIQGMRDHIARPFYLTPEDWDEVFRRVASGSCY